MKRNFKLIQYLLLKKVIDPDTGCWFVENCKDKNHYYNGSINGKRDSLPRLSAIAFLEFDPNNDLKLEICHKCDTPACFNPDHLYIGTHGSNKRDWFARQARISDNHCIRGHEYSIDKSGNKICKACKLIYYYNSLKQRWPDKALKLEKKHPELIVH